MKVQAKHGKVTQNMHGASRNYRYAWDESHGDLHLHVREPPMAISISMYSCPRGDLHLHAIVSTAKCYIRYYAITN